MKYLATLSLAAALLAGAALPANAATQSAQEKKAARLERKLTRLPNAGGPPAAVIRYTRQLVKLEPRKSKRWYKLSTLKLVAVFVERKAQRMANIARRLVGQSDLNRSLQRRIQRQITKIERRVIQFNEPTPVPYQANAAIPREGLAG